MCLTMPNCCCCTGKQMKILKILFAGIVAMLCAMLTGCATYLDLFEEDYTEWYSQDGSVSITSTLSDGYAFGHFTVNGIEVRACFETTYRGTLWLTFPYSEDLDIVTERNGVYRLREDGICGGEMTGTREGDVFHVTGMEVGFTQLGTFDLYSRRADPAGIDARDYVGCYWKSDDGLFVIDAYFDYPIRDVCRATLALNGESHYMAFAWRDGNGFALYDFDAYAADRESCELLAGGTYTNAGGQLTLYVEEATAFGLAGQQIELTATKYYNRQAI